MLPYGSKKRKSTPHPHNECGVCGEEIINKKSERQRIKNELRKIKND